MKDTLKDAAEAVVARPASGDAEGLPAETPGALWEPPSGLAGDEPDRAANQRLQRALRDGPPDAAEQPRFHKRPLVRFLLESSYAAQRLKPETAEALAGQAISLASAMLRPAEGDPWVLSAAGCAWCLAASALRRLGRLEQARAALPKAAYFLGLAGGPVERALYLRVAALLRWDQGRLDEAEALLVAAIDQGEAAGRAADAMAARALLGLLHAERGEAERAVAALEPALPLLPADDLRVPVHAEAGLVLAACLAQTGELERARAALETARGWLPRLKTAWEHNRSRWLQARALQHLGEAAAAGGLFQKAEYGLSEQKDLANVLLMRLDGLAVEVERGRYDAAERQTNWTALGRNWPGKDLALSVLRQLAAQPPDPTGLHDAAGELAREVRLKLRSRQIQVESPPFAG